MTDDPKIVYAQVSRVADELHDMMEAARAVTLFAGEITGLARILDQVAADHPDAAGGIVKVAQIIRIGAEFAQTCNQRIVWTWNCKVSMSSAAKGGVQ